MLRYVTLTPAFLQCMFSLFHYYLQFSLGPLSKLISIVFVLVVFFRNPSVASQPSCIPAGPIGVATNGLVLYNPWTNQALNAVEGDTAETFDMCDGHPDERGSYHYHKEPSSCLFSVTPGTPSPMVGVAFDGFAIYGPVDEEGKTLTSADLDECHGRLNSNGVYQYHTTTDFPYLLGCYKGTPSSSAGTNQCYFASDADENGNIGSGGGGPPRPPPPPPGRR